MPRNAGNGDGTEIAAVAGVGAIVPHHPDRAIRDEEGIGDLDAYVGRGEGIAGFTVCVGFVELDPVYNDKAVDHIDGLPAGGDAAFDQGLLVSRRIGECDDLALLYVIEVIGYLFRQDVIPDFNSRIHGAGRYLKRLYDKRFDTPCESESDSEHYEELKRASHK